MKLFCKRTLAVALAAGIVAPPAAFATNGMFLIGYGSKSRAMGGVGVALPQDGLAAASNPAAMAEIPMNVMRVDVAGEFFNPPRAVRVEATPISTRDPETNDLESIKSGANLFLIPAMGGAFKFNRDLTVGMAAVGAGLGTRYDQSCNATSPVGNYFNIACGASQDRFSTVGVSMMQMQMLPSVAYKVSRNHYLGASLALAVQTFRAYGIGAGALRSFSRDPDKLSNNGNDWSYGAGFRLGWLGKFFDERVNVGANYSSRVYMTEFNKYKGLFAEKGDFDIPENYALGIAVMPTDKLTVAFDVHRIEWNSIKSIGNPGPNVNDTVNSFNPLCPNTAIDTAPECQLGGKLGWGFGWENQTVYKLGIAYDYNSQWTFRVGYNYAESPIQENEILFNTLAPATVEKHVTFGLSYRPVSHPNLEISANYMHAYKNTIKGKAAFPAGAVAGDAAASMYQNSLGVTIGYKL
ncbi:OmpP1/FadL family transporter [Thiohalobacter thiocyanaticus]|uniref:Long-chain fatty acid transporter n=1 Tax=Thiohalobacter thiocyanaticus TaxID=585455 RepID=A0A426QI79_9GAMM|nr:outer membrane protein transport protein [Thiohalobacter thiocyanaticus]RRQ21450.1 hypothetical protein D6C00_05520 [Thiohalobacter thiocyanaticus]